LNDISWDKESKTLIVAIQMRQQGFEVNSDYVRMDGYGYWQVKEVSSGTIELIFQMQIDPGGAIKAWMANMFVTDSPYQTLLGMREAMMQEKYLGKTYKFLND